MLEKIGLPAKPAAKGSAWVIDASHCQSCSSPFSIFNRKHHCRRCGGIFCGNCVQSRMMLRGQGDAPVRICEPCRKIEEAARFEARYGHRNKQKKGGSFSSCAEDADLVLKSLLNDDVVTSSASSSDLPKDGQTPNKSTEDANATPISPEALRLRAQDEKKKYSVLKTEGKPDEALKAFKRAKELEREADALAVSLRKSSRIAAKSSTKDDHVLQVGGTESLQEKLTHDKEPSEPTLKDKKARSNNADEKDDLMKALKELGWIDVDLDDTGKKQKVDADILEVEAKTASNKTPASPSAASGTFRMEILGHKRKALALKREGKLTEAKDELKKAKLLERRLEELETLGAEEDDDDDGDELAAIMRSLEKEAMKDTKSRPGKEVFLNADGLPRLSDDEGDAHVDVTDNDLSDPDMIAALKAMGWEEEAATLQSFRAPLDGSTNDVEKADLQAQILSHKRKALALKRAGNVVEAREELKQAKSLEQVLDSSKNPDLDFMSTEVDEHVDVTEQDMQDPQFMATLRALGLGDEEPEALVADVRVNPQDKLALQQEILAIKRSALALKRQGKATEAREELRQAKVLEEKLQTTQRQAEKESHLAFQTAGSKERRTTTTSYKNSSIIDSDDEDADVGIQNQDITTDPELAAIFRGLSLDNKTEDDPVPSSKDPGTVTDSTARKARRPSHTLSGVPQRSKLDLQKELLGKKRKALNLRREGKVDEAEKELEEAKVLEMQLKEAETPQDLNAVEGDEEEDDDSIVHAEVTEEDMNDPNILAALGEMGFKDDDSLQEMPHKEKAEKAVGDSIFQGEYGEIGLSVDIAPPLFPHFTKGRSSTLVPPAIQQHAAVDLLTGDDWRPAVEQPAVSTILDAVTQKTPDFAPQKILEPTRKQVKESPALLQQRLVSPPTGNQVKQTRVVSQQKPLPEAIAVEGKGSSSKQETKQKHSEVSATSKMDASTLSSGPQEILAHRKRALTLKKEGNLVGAREELRQARLLEKQVEVQASVTQAPVQGQIPHQATKTQVEVKVPSETRQHSVSQAMHREQAPQPRHAARDRMKLQQESLAHKRRALGLRREGKVDEAEAEFEIAKAIEKQMEELEPQQPPRPGVNPEDGVEDAFDPQLVAALAGLGWKDANLFGVTEATSQPHKRTPSEVNSTRATSGDVQNRQAGSKGQGQTQLLEERIKALKLRAVELKRAGKRQEALDTLRDAKRLEKGL